MSKKLEDRPDEVDIKEILSQLELLGGAVEDHADRVKRLVERADKFVNSVGPKLGVGAEIDTDLPRGNCEHYSRLVICRWDKGPAADNADGQWHIVYQAWAPGFLHYNSDRPEFIYEDEPAYCQSLPSAKLDFRMAAVPLLPNLLQLYLSKAKRHLDELAAVQTQLNKLESELGQQIDDEVAFRDL